MLSRSKRKTGFSVVANQLISVLSRCIPLERAFVVLAMLHNCPPHCHGWRSCNLFSLYRLYYYYIVMFEQRSNFTSKQLWKFPCQRRRSGCQRGKADAWTACLESCWHPAAWSCCYSCGALVTSYCERNYGRKFRQFHCARCWARAGGPNLRKSEAGARRNCCATNPGIPIGSGTWRHSGMAYIF